MPPLMLGPWCFFLCVCLCLGVICQAVVAEVEPLRLKGYDPRSAASTFVCVYTRSAGDPPRAQAIIDLSPEEWVSGPGQGTTKTSSAYFR